MDMKSWSRRALIVGALSTGAFLVADPVGRAITRWTSVAATPTSAVTFPAWVRATPQSHQAYQAALAHLDLIATLPCFCGCDRMDLHHTSLRDCFVLPDGRLERHGSVCGTCQGEAIDAASLADRKTPWPEIRTLIVAAYAPPGHPARQRST